MPKDFLSSQIKIDKIIGSNDQGNPKLLVYPDSKSTDNIGGIDSSMLSGAGTDTFLFISGSISGKSSIEANSVSIFGGDLVVSGALYSEDKLFVQGSSTFNTNKTGDSDFIIKTLNKDFGLKVNSQNDTIQFMSGGSPNSPDESTYTDTNFFVSGSIGSAHQPDLGPQIGNGDRGTSVFGGDVFVSGTLWTKDVNLTNISIGGQVISLKGYVENGEFVNRNTVVGNDSIALGNDHNLESNNSFILGNRANRILGKDNYYYNTIIGALNSEISGSSHAVILGGDNNEIKNNASPSYVIGSNNVEVNRAEILALYSDNLFASGSVFETFILGNNNTVVGTLENRSEHNFILGRKNEVFETSRSFILNFGDQNIYRPENSDNPTPLTTMTGSINTFVVSRGSDVISGSNTNTIFTENSDILGVSNSFISGKDNKINNTQNSIIFNENTSVRYSNNLVSLGGKNSSFSDDDPDIINNELNKRNISDFIAESGRNVSIGGDFTTVSGSYNTLVGGAKNNITGSNSSIFGSIYSSITNSSGSVIVGGINNRISNNKNIVVGSDNTVAGERSFVIGNDITSTNDDTFILGSGNRAKETSLILSASKFEFGDLTKDKVYGKDTNFFASGSIGARQRFLNGSNVHDDYYGVAVFGGDLHVSGNISGGNFELFNLFFEGGESRGTSRSLGNTDAQDLSFLTKGFNRVTVKGSSGALNVGGMLPENGEENVQLHVRTGSYGSYQFDSSLDSNAASTYPLLISRNVQQQINDATPLEIREVGMAFTSYPTLNDTGYHEGIQEEPGAAITHRIKGRNSKGDLLFKTKTEEGQISLGDAGSLTTKLVITSAGEMLLGNDNPQGHYIDLRVSGSEKPLIQASGSTGSGRIISIGDTDSIGKAQLDTIFHVHGIPGSKKNLPSSRLVSSFGGDAVVSGTLYVEADVNVPEPGIDLHGSLLILGDINSKDADLAINAQNDIALNAQNDIALNAENDVTVKNDLVVTNNITGSHIKGDGLEISNVNKSSIWEVVGTDPVTGFNLLSPGDFIDGNTGVHMVDLFTTIDESRKQGRPEIAYSPTTNTRLYDTYYEIEKDAIGQVKYIIPSSVPGDPPIVEGHKPITTERVESPEQLIISLK